MKLLIAIMTIVITTISYAGTSMQLEGSCQGTSKGQKINFKYYSNFDGCKQSSTAAIAFNNSGLLTGRRFFHKDKDIYVFPDKVRLEFANSTGNVSGLLKMNGQKIKVNCNIRDYEYATEC